MPIVTKTPLLYPFTSTTSGHTLIWLTRCVRSPCDSCTSVYCKIMKNHFDLRYEYAVIRFIIHVGLVHIRCTYCSTIPSLTTGGPYMFTSLLHVHLLPSAFSVELFFLFYIVTVVPFSSIQCFVFSLHSRNFFASLLHLLWVFCAPPVWDLAEFDALKSLLWVLLEVPADGPSIGPLSCAAPRAEGRRAWIPWVPRGRHPSIRA